MKPSRFSQLSTSSLLLLSLLTSANSHAIAEHTINRQGTSDFTISRNLPERFDDADLSLAGCIAQPDSWSAPLQVTSQSGSILARYAEGEATIDSIQALEGYSWYCYQDSQRTINAEEVVSLSFQLSTEDANSQVYTSVGSIEGVSVGPRTMGDYFYQTISSHQVIRDQQAADYYANITSQLEQSAADQAESINANSYTSFNIEGTSYFLGSNGFSFSLDNQGQFQSYQTPSNTRPFYANGQFIFLISQGEPIVTSRHIQFGSELNNLSQVYDISEIGYTQSLTYDVQNSQYVMFNTGNPTSADRAYYTSTDLITWTANTVGQYQNSQAVFANDGRAVMKNYSLVDSLMSRTENGEWQNFQHYPSAQNFSARDILFAHDRFFVLLTEYSNDEENKGAVLSSRLGYSDDLTSWTWQTLSTNPDDIASTQSLVELGANQIAIINDETFYLSNDKGESWSSAISAQAALGLEASVDVTELEVRIENLISLNGSLVGSARISMADDELSHLIFTTVDGSEFESVHRTQDVKLFSNNDELYFYEYNWNDWALFKATPASSLPETPDNNGNKDDDDGISLGSLNLTLNLSPYGLLVITALLAFRRRTNH